jgi:enamine deaminase RidA (YjgF/YER057c/UK114 family)
MKREAVSSGAPWEDSVAYSRAVRVRDHIYVSGTTAVRPDGTVEGAGDPYAQTIAVLGTIRRALERLGSSIDDVVRTRMFVTDIDHWEAIGRAHGEVFRDVRPASTMVEVTRLIERDVLVEIEADAIASPKH